MLDPRLRVDPPLLDEVKGVEPCFTICGHFVGGHLQGVCNHEQLGTPEEYDGTPFFIISLRTKELNGQWGNWPIIFFGSAANIRIYSKVSEWWAISGHPWILPRINIKHCLDEKYKRARAIIRTGSSYFKGSMFLLGCSDPYWVRACEEPRSIAKSKKIAEREGRI